MEYEVHGASSLALSKELFRRFKFARVELDHGRLQGRALDMRIAQLGKSVELLP